MGQQTIAIDFDGVIHKYSKGWQDGSIYDGPIDGAIEAIWKLTNKGYRIVIFTARENTAVVSHWIMDRIMKCESLIGKSVQIDNIKVTNKKPRAIAYIDDRGIRFTNWKDILNYF